jgi:hypothetical protein
VAPEEICWKRVAQVKTRHRKDTQEQQRQAALATTVEEFCRNISAALDNPSFETKQKIAAPGGGTS